MPKANAGMTTQAQANEVIGIEIELIPVIVVNIQLPHDLILWDVAQHTLTSIPLSDRLSNALCPILRVRQVALTMYIVGAVGSSR